MKRSLILSPTLQIKFGNINFNTGIWQSVNINNSIDLGNMILKSLMALNTKLKVSDLEFQAVNKHSINFGHIIDSKTKKEVAYVYIIPPGTDSRSGFIGQQVYPAHINILESIQSSMSFEPFHKPVYIINTNEYNLTESKLLNISGARTMGFYYTDIFKRITPHKFKNLAEFDLALRQVNHAGQNHYFEMDKARKIITFIPNTLKSNTNDRYFYSAKAFPALYLASNECYKIDTSKLESDPNTKNGTLQAFINYANKLKSI